MFVGVIFSVMHKFFGHIHSDMLIRSKDCSSFHIKFILRLVPSVNKLVVDFTCQNLLKVDTIFLKVFFQASIYN